MKVTIEHDDGKTEEFRNVSDAFLAVRQYEPMARRNGDTALLPETRSYSWGPNVRETLKEIRQAAIELQRMIDLRGTTETKS